MPLCTRLRMLTSLKKKIVILLGSGLLLAIIGLSIYVTFPMIMDKAIDKKLVLEEGSETYKIWQDLPVPIYIHFYFFNITNIDEIWALKNKPILEEIGPYTFRESREKVDIVWDDGNGTVSYKQVKRWYFQPDRTNGSLDDEIMTLNVPMVAAAASSKKFDQSLIYYALEKIFNSLDSKWFVKKKVRELLFEGYEDKLMEIAKTFMNLPYDKFGWFYMRNGSDDGELNVFTGKTNILKLDEVHTWNGKSSVSSYDPPCNMINGSAGDVWPKDLKRGGQVSLFVTDICRSLTFTYLGDEELQGIKAYRYWTDNKQLDNGYYDPSNKCFCPEDICLPAGGLNVSSCKFDAPAVVSYPHFLFADPVYSQGVIGMKPDPLAHRMYLDLIPEMGIPVRVAARMQINIVFESNPNITQFENITERIYFPIFWFSETAEANDDMISLLKTVLITLPLIANIISFILIAKGSFLVLSAFVLSILYALGKNEPSYSAVS